MEKVAPDSSMFFNRVNADSTAVIRELSEGRKQEEQALAKAANRGCSCANLLHHQES